MEGITAKCCRQEYPESISLLSQIAFCKVYKDHNRQWSDRPRPCFFWASLQASPLIISSREKTASPWFRTPAGCGHNTVSRTVIDCGVLRCQAAELHVGCARGFVCSQCGLALELLSIVSSTNSRMNSSYPLQVVSCSLLHPVHIVVGEGISRSPAKHLHWGPRLQYLRPRLIHLDLGMDTCGENTDWMSGPLEWMSHFKIWELGALTCNCYCQ